MALPKKQKQKTYIDYKLELLNPVNRNNSNYVKPTKKKKITHKKLLKELKDFKNFLEKNLEMPQEHIERGFSKDMFLTEEQEIAQINFISYIKNIIISLENPKNKKVLMYSAFRKFEYNLETGEVVYPTHTVRNNPKKAEQALIEFASVYQKFLRNPNKFYSSYYKRISQFNGIKAYSYLKYNSVEGAKTNSDNSYYKANQSFIANIIESWLNEEIENAELAKIEVPEESDEELLERFYEELLKEETSISNSSEPREWTEDDEELVFDEKLIKPSRKKGWTKKQEEKLKKAGKRFWENRFGDNNLYVGGYKEPKKISNNKKTKLKNINIDFDSLDDYWKKTEQDIIAKEKKEEEKRLKKLQEKEAQTKTKGRLDISDIEEIRTVIFYLRTFKYVAEVNLEFDKIIKNKNLSKNQKYKKISSLLKESSSFSMRQNKSYLFGMIPEISKGYCVRKIEDKTKSWDKSGKKFIKYEIIDKSFSEYNLNKYRKYVNDLKEFTNSILAIFTEDDNEYTKEVLENHNLKVFSNTEEKRKFYIKNLRYESVNFEEEGLNAYEVKEVLFGKSIYDFKKHCPFLVSNEYKADLFEYYYQNKELSRTEIFFAPLATNSLRGRTSADVKELSGQEIAILFKGWNSYDMKSAIFFFLRGLGNHKNMTIKYLNMYTKNIDEIRNLLAEKMDKKVSDIKKELNAMVYNEFLWSLGDIKIELSNGKTFKLNGLLEEIKEIKKSYGIEKGKITKSSEKNAFWSLYEKWENSQRMKFLKENDINFNSDQWFDKHDEIITSEKVTWLGDDETVIWKETLWEDTIKEIKMMVEFSKNVYSSMLEEYKKKVSPYNRCKFLENKCTVDMDKKEKWAKEKLLYIDDMKEFYDTFGSFYDFNMKESYKKWKIHQENKKQFLETQKELDDFDLFDWDSLDESISPPPEEQLLLVA